jgi:hypothetical protein
MEHETLNCLGVNFRIICSEHKATDAEIITIVSSMDMIDKILAHENINDRFEKMRALIELIFELPDVRKETILSAVRELRFLHQEIHGQIQ